MITASKTHISTMVYEAYYNSLIDIEAIFETLQIDDVIIGLKYMNMFKGKVKQTSAFFNSITVIIYLEQYDKEVNMKVFTNGKVQLSGVKNDQHVICAMTTFKNIIDNIIYTKNVKVIIINNVIYNKNEHTMYINKKHTRFDVIKIYGKTTNSSSYKIIGDRKGNDFTILIDGIREKVLEFDEDYFIQLKKTPEHIKLLFDKNGNIVGEVKYVFRKTRRNIPIKGTQFIEDTEVDLKSIQNNEDHINCIKTISMYDRFNNFIGKQIVYLDKPVVPTENTDNIPLKCVACSSDNIDYKLKPFNINCDFKLSITENEDYYINLVGIYTKLRSIGITTYYDPSANDPALNIKLYFLKNTNGSVHQILTDKLFESKKEHKPPTLFDLKASIRVFNTNKVSIHGCTDKSQIIIVKQILLDLFNMYFTDFYKQYKQCDNTTTNQNISIFDLM